MQRKERQQVLDLQPFSTPVDKRYVRNDTGNCFYFLQFLVLKIL